MVKQRKEVKKPISRLGIFKLSHRSYPHFIIRTFIRIYMCVKAMKKTNVSFCCCNQCVCVFWCCCCFHHHMPAQQREAAAEAEESLIS